MTKAQIEDEIYRVWRMYAKIGDWNLERGWHWSKRTRELVGDLCERLERRYWELRRMIS